MGKENLLFKLDQVEYQLRYLNGTSENFKPRFKQTSQFFESKSRKVDKKRSKLLNDACEKDLRQNFDSISLKILEQKIHYVLNKLQACFSKNKMLVSNETVKEIGTDKFAKYVAYSKVIKLTVSLLGGLKNLPVWFQRHEFYTYLNNKDHELNPSRIYNKIFVELNLNALNSKLLNDKKVKELLQLFENAIHLLLNQKEKSKKRGREETEVSTGLQDVNPESNVKSHIERDGTKHSLSTTGDDDSKHQDELSSEEEERLIKQYDGMLAASDDESEDDFKINPNVDYNQVTDEELSEDENVYSELDENSVTRTESHSNKKQKLDLPELMTGYYSGDDNESFEEDDILKDQTSEKPKRKNRRGQRARQKIWEKKYGKHAKHIQRELEKERAEKERKRIEFEERKARREAKAAIEEKAALEHGKFHFGKPAQPESTFNSKSKDEPLHPSWVAKKMAEEKQKSIKFQGKKITFD